MAAHDVVELVAAHDAEEAAVAAHGKVELVAVHDKVERVVAVHDAVELGVVAHDAVGHVLVAVGNILGDFLLCWPCSCLFRSRVM